MRITQGGGEFVLAARPYQGATEGASLYLGTPDQKSIRYRTNLVLADGVDVLPASKSTIDFAAASIAKTKRVASVTSPTNSMTDTLPASLLGVPVFANVRTYWNDYENEQVSGAAYIGVKSDGSGPDNRILGRATIQTPQKRDGGGMLLLFAYNASPVGLQPLQFQLVQTSGPGSLPNAVINSAGRSNSIEIDGLTNATAYGWELQAVNGSVTANLGSVTFTADAAGPGGVSGVTAVPD